ncbi:MAG TPA: TonB-dependent receptor [Burkholderiaceae bacterium]|nr:TonB-dependent receptor [Burkholderiaceae bacterium]
MHAHLARRAIAAAIAAAFVPALHAQSRPATTTEPVQTLSPVFVTANPLRSGLFDLADPVNLLEGRELLMKRQPTLGDTLAREVGVTQTYFGPNASRPLIRGLGGFDIRLLNNGLSVFDASAASPDHAVAISPFAVERIEVVRGPATVLYGGGALGGVVNTLDRRIAETAPSTPISGTAAYTYDSQNDLSAGGLRLNGGNAAFALHADAYATRNGDLRIPGAAWTPQVQIERGERGPSGRLPNSQGDSQTYGLGGTAFLGERGYAGVSYSQFDTNYGTVAEPGVTIELSQRAWSLASELRDPVPGLESLRLRYAYNDYQHTEFEDGEAGTVFKSRGWNLRAEGRHRPLGDWRGVLGVELVDVDFSAQGAEAFLPSTATRTAAGFLYEEWSRDAWRVMLGGRLEGVEIEAQPFLEAGQGADSRSFTPWSVALGTYYTLDERNGVGANLQYAQRAPTAQELFANGVHVATNQYELGNRNLAKVAGTALDLAWKFRSTGLNATIGAFYSRYSNFIALLPTDQWRDPETRAPVPGPAPIVDPDTGELIYPVQQFDFTGVPARFYGFELQASAPLWSSGARQLALQLQADYVNASSDGTPLPYIPPLRAGAALAYQQEGFNATLGALWAAGQDRVPNYQTTTAGYTNLYLSASYLWAAWQGAQVELFVEGQNLLDDTIRYSTSALKDLAPAGGRSIKAGVRGSF